MVKGLGNLLILLIKFNKHIMKLIVKIKIFILDKIVRYL